MPDAGKNHTSPPDPDGDGVRVIRTRLPRTAWLMVLMLLVLVAVGIGTLFYSMPSTPSHSTTNESAPTQGTLSTTPALADAPVETADKNKAMITPRITPRPQAQPQTNSADLRSGDANDIATYVSPTDPEPTMAEVIQALHDSGEHGGIAAFNPPGTSPPLQGLAVPDDFVLPPGYVRHHQVTDDGEPIEPILMFAPDFVFRDAAGQPIPVPENRVVPPEMAPPGLEIRPITIPSTPPPE